MDPEVQKGAGDMPACADRDDQRCRDQCYQSPKAKGGALANLASLDSDALRPYLILNGRNIRIEACKILESLSC